LLKTELFQKISIPTPRKVDRNSKGRGRGVKAQLLKGKYEAKPEFPGVAGFKLKIVLWGINIF